MLQNSQRWEAGRMPPCKRRIKGWQEHAPVAGKRCGCRCPLRVPDKIWTVFLAQLKGDIVDAPPPLRPWGVDDLLVQQIAGKRNMYSSE